MIIFFFVYLFDSVVVCEQEPAFKAKEQMGAAQLESRRYMYNIF